MCDTVKYRYYTVIIPLLCVIPLNTVIMCCQTFVVGRSPHFFISQEIKSKKNIMNSTIQTEWVPDDPPSPGSPWITNTDSFSGHFDNLEGRCTFITWALGKHCYSIQGISHVLKNISDFSREPDRHVYHSHTGIHLLTDLLCDVTVTGNHDV